MQLFWSRVPRGRTGLTCLQFCCERGRDRAAFVGVRNFSPEHYWWFWNIFIFFSPPFFFPFLSTFAVAMLWFAFCSVVRLPSSFVILMSRWISPIQNLCFYFVFSFHYRKESFLKPSDVLMWYFSCSWAHRFVVFCFFLLCFPPLFFPRSRYTFAGGIVKYFWMIIFFWLDDAGWTRGVLILLGVRCVFVFCVNEDEQTFSFLQVYKYELTSCCICNKKKLR